MQLHRTHFHDFMLDVHSRLRKYSSRQVSDRSPSTLKGGPDQLSSRVSLQQQHIACPLSMGSSPADACIG